MFTAQCFLFQKTRTDQRWCWSQRLHLSVWTTTPKTPTLWWGEAITDRLVGSGLHIVREVSFSLLPGLFTYTCVLFSVLGYPERESASGVFFFGAHPQRPSVQDHMAAVQDWNRCLLCLHRWTGRLIDGLANPLKPFKITLYLSVCQVLWWDVRKLAEPTECLVLDPSREGNLDQALGATSLEFEPTMVRAVSVLSI